MIDLYSEMPYLKINIDPKIRVGTSKRKRVESDESDDDSPTYQVTPHYKSISSDIALHTSLIYPLEKHVSFPWEVSLVLRIYLILFTFRMRAFELFHRS